MEPQQNQAPTQNKKTKLPFIIIALVALTLIIAFVAMNLTSKRSETTNPPTTNNEQALNTQTQAAKTAELSTEPVETKAKAGEVTTLSVWVDTGGQKVSTVEAYLTYPADKFELVNIDSSESAFEIEAEQTGADGKISITRGQIGGVDGKVLLAKVNLKAKTNDGQGALSFTNESKVYPLAIDPQATVAQDILNKASGAKIIIGE